MKYLSITLPFVLILAFVSTSCNTTFQTQTLEYSTYRINNNLPKDSSLINFLTPYSNNVNKLMNGVIGYVEKNMDKKLPESELGNFMADAYLHMAREKYNTQVDAAFMNYGGIRLNQIPVGNITTGRIFELMPFDNLLVLQKIKGSVLQEFLDLTANKGGWPVAGITMEIKDLPEGQVGKKAVEIMIGGKRLDPESVYTVTNSNFVANGGENADMLKSIPQIVNGYLMRDALFDYIKWLKSQGRNISASVENRVIYAQ